MKAVAANSIRRWRWWQFRLRSLLVLTTLLCVALSVHVARRQARERYLIRTVNLFNSLFDEQRYVEAAVVARKANYWYPSPLTDQMLEKATLACQISLNESTLHGQPGCVCYFTGTGDETTPADTAWQIHGLTDWEVVSPRKRRFDACLVPGPSHDP